MRRQRGIGKWWQAIVQDRKIYWADGHRRLKISENLLQGVDKCPSPYQNPYA